MSFRSLPSKARTVVSRFIQELSDNYPSIEQAGSLQDPLGKNLDFLSTARQQNGSIVL